MIKNAKCRGSNAVHIIMPYKGGFWGRGPLPRAVWKNCQLFQSVTGTTLSRNRRAHRSLVHEYFATDELFVEDVAIK